uniref:Pecanex-like protein n=1 Tax=Macrostomum lignano TaxID=282301 RepID=A0A1I8FEB9_9PLAT
LYAEDIDSMLTRWTKCINSAGNYIEKASVPTEDDPSSHHCRFRDRAAAATTTVASVPGQHNASAYVVVRLLGAKSTTTTVRAWRLLGSKTSS